MATELYTHPTPEQLRAFAQGRLSSAEMAELEKHIAYCDSCCLQLARIPDDTLVQLAREAATEGVKSPVAKPVDQTPKSSPGDIPKELREHPRYRVLSLVGHGGMGAVYKAEHRKMERLVALKVINQHLLANTQAVERFSREVRAVSKLSHPNIVLVHDADEAGSLHFLVMEFVDGVSLDRFIAHNGPLTPALAANFIVQAARGLQHAHEKGMVHRDIKPQNLMKTRKGEIKILDFGLARLGQDRGFERAGQGEERPARPGETTAGMVLGTPDYIAPEQASDARTADIRADIYSLGCTLYYLLTGQPPYPTGTTIEKLSHHLTSAPPPILAKRSDVPAELARILDKMLAKNPKDRYQTPGEVAKDLVPVSRGAESPPSGRRQPPGNLVSPAPAQAPQDFATIVTTAPAGGLVPVPSTEYSVLTTSVLDDIKLDGSLPTLPPVVQPPSGSGLPLGATPWVAGIVACGVATAIMLLAWGVADSLFRDDPEVTSAHPTESSPLTTEIADKQTPPAPPGVSSPASQARTTPAAAGGVIASNLPRKVLLVVPSRELHLPDYENLRFAFEDKLGIELDVASTTRNAVQTLSGELGPAPDRVVDASLKAEGYGAVLFAGLSTDEYHPGQPAGYEIARLLKEFEQDNKIIGSICAGQRALARHGILSDKRVADCRYVGSNEQIGTRDTNWFVVEDRQVITASADKDAGTLAQRIAKYLKP